MESTEFFLLEVVKTDERDDRDEIGTIRLPCRVRFASFWWQKLSNFTFCTTCPIQDLISLLKPTLAVHRKMAEWKYFTFVPA